MTNIIYKSQYVKDTSRIVLRKPRLIFSIKFYNFYFRFFELEVNGQRDEVRIHYTHDQESTVETFPYRLADNQWHVLAVTLSGTHVTIFVNCSKIYERVIRTVDRTTVIGNLKLYVGQRNGQHALFRVSTV